ncbi:hypothetical protein HZU77_017005, partial [Neisseriaceae bacterium TC5R-5]|nr:hypothetical protein [Neisseriaceae bacterium TC5R-5]
QPEQCQSFLLLEASDYASLQTSAALWESEPAQMASFFGFSFGLVLTCYLAAFGFGVLFSMFKKGF